MKKKTILILTVLAATLFAAVPLLSVDQLIKEKFGKKEVEKNGLEPIHPEVKPLDRNGRVTGNARLVSTETSCAPCHDTKFINKHNDHFNDKVKADCFVCHLEGSRLQGNLNDINKNIQVPSDENCAYCHGVVHAGEYPLSFPDDYQKELRYKEGGKDYSLTQNTGVVISGQEMNQSFVNLKNKEELDAPWDIHAHRKLTCTSCHFTKNDPRSCGIIQSELEHLVRDPRKVQEVRDYLRWPNHNFRTAFCRCCHDPLKVHKDLPYKRRHMEVVQCQSCHVPNLRGPAFQAVDETVVTAEGLARIEYRAIENPAPEGNISTAFVQGYSPNLFANEALCQLDNTVRTMVAPFNLVTSWYWKSGEKGERVPLETVKEAYFEGGSYAGEIVELLDENNNSRVDPGELVLNTKEKVAFVKERLEKLGIAKPVIAAEYTPHKINHSVMEVKDLVLDCNNCHYRDSRLGNDIVMAGMVPATAKPVINKGNKAYINGKIRMDKEGRLVMTRKGNLEDLYVLGLGRVLFIDILGVVFLFLTVIGISAHGTLRYLADLRMEAEEHVRTVKVYMYGFYERSWHWIMAAGVLMLILTGVEIHNAGTLPIFGLKNAVTIHNVLAIIVLVNAFLSLFYHVTTGEIKQYFSVNRHYFQETVVQALYYVQGIFKGDPHPVKKSPERKFNPLQQITYIILLNVLIPYQIITGVMMWGVQQWPALSDAVGGLTWVAPMHNLGSWLFLTFVVVHVYLTTTGHTVFANIKAMVTGYDELPDEEPKDEQKAMMDMNLGQLLRTASAALKRDLSELFALLRKGEKHE